MAFVVEDGTGLAAATSLLSVADFHAYHGDRGRDTTGFGDSAVEAALVRATDFIEVRWGDRLPGVPLTEGQALCLPRSGLYDTRGDALEGVPVLAERACAEYALRAAIVSELLPDAPAAAGTQNLSDPTAPVTTAGQTSGIVSEREQRLGELLQKTAYASHADLIALSGRQPPASSVSGVWIPEYPRADLWMERLVSSGRSRGLTRA